ncbi:MAG: hypothetical protein IPP36_12265 [Nitrosomonadales bacterium]|nr:hypothetical protein [Nitrosomonadales bacterium]
MPRSPCRLPNHLYVFFRNNLRTFINADTVLDHASPLLPLAFAAAWFLAAQMLEQVSSITFVCVDMPVDRLMANLQHLPAQPIVVVLGWRSSRSTARLPPNTPMRMLAIDAGLATPIT